MTSRKLIAVVISALFAGSAFAAEVQLYGRIDEGLVYTHQDLDNGTDKTDEFKMRSGYSTSSRFGLTGTETLGNGWKVGFTLENGFNADDGSFADDDRLFNREATVSLTGGFGTLAFGRWASCRPATARSASRANSLRSARATATTRSRARTSVRATPAWTT